MSNRQAGGDKKYEMLRDCNEEKTMNWLRLHPRIFFWTFLIKIKPKEENGEIISAINFGDFRLVALCGTTHHQRNILAVSLGRTTQ